ncbi:hypothetical protein DAMA08_017510 [Martiniozyma asiatica (nom. inval.)]|nr:hypothetical protein DAMA08_017510 [Martiniozyma asiatica]
MTTSTLEAYVAVELLYDKNFHPQKVSSIPGISSSGPILGKNTTSLFNKEEVIFKQFEQWLATSHGELSKLCKLYWQQKSLDIKKSKDKNKSLGLFIDGFQHFLIVEGFSVTESDYYRLLIGFIDIILTLKSSESQKKLMISKRSQLLQLYFLPKPELSQTSKDTVVESFNITQAELFQLENKIQNTLNKEDVGRYVQLNGLSKKYMPHDFDSIAKYKNWITETEQLEKIIIKEFGETQRKISNFSFVPTDLHQSVVELTTILINSKADFLKSYMDCLRLWQFDPFDLQFIFLQLLDFPSLKNDKSINDRLAKTLQYSTQLQKYSGLALTCAPIQVEFNNWPIKSQSKMVETGMRVYQKINEPLMDLFKHFFDDSKSFTAALEIINQLKITGSVLGVKAQIKEAVASSIKERSNLYFKKSGIVENSSSSNLNFDQMSTYLTVVSRDINLLYNWKMMNPLLNTTFGIYEFGSKIIMSPVINFVRNFVTKIKKEVSNSKSISNNNKINQFLNSDKRKSFSFFLDTLNKLKERTGFNFDFQNELYGEFVYLVNSWQEELLNQIKESVKLDLSSGLIRVDGSSSSKSARNVIGILDGYISLLDSFNWTNPFQLAELNVKLYKLITNGVELYYTLMFDIIQKNISKVVDLESEACTCINNLWIILTYIKNLLNKETVKKSSQILNENGRAQLKLPKKFVSIFIKSAENVETLKGEPVSLKVCLSGVVNGETRTIHKDYNPEWFEAFSGFEDFKAISNSNKRSSIVNGSISNSNLKFSLLNADDFSTYKTIHYKIDLIKERSNGEEKKISLSPRAGCLIFNTSVEFERNDPIFYIGKTITMIEKNITRAIKLFVDEYTLKMKDIFSREYLDNSLIEAPVKSENNYQRLLDINLNQYTASMRNKLIPEMSQNLMPELFDQIMLEIWEKVVHRAQDLLLPRLSQLDHKVQNKLNKKSKFNSLVNSNSSNYRKTTREDVIRVIEWVFKFREMLDNSSIRVDLQEEFNKSLKKLANIKDLNKLSVEELEVRYFHAWNYICHNMKKVKLKADYDRVGWENAQKDKNLMLRVLLSKGSVGVKDKVEVEKRFNRAIKTELDVIYLEQFL